MYQLSFFHFQAISPKLQRLGSITDAAQKWFRTREQKIKTGTSSYLNLVSPNRFDAFLKTILTFIAALLLLCPVLILFEIQPADPTQIKSRGRTQFGVVFVFTFAFSACCFLFTKATKQEVFTATAAYSAVLVVFLGNASQALTCANTGWRTATRFVVHAFLFRVVTIFRSPWLHVRYSDPLRLSIITTRF